MKEFTYTITDEQGIHARPAGLLVKEAAGFASAITIEKDGKKVDAIDATFGKADFDDKDRILLKKGKKKFCQIKEK